MPREGKISRLYPYYCDSVRFNEDTLPSALPTHLAECLRRAGAWEVDVDDNRVIFKGSSIGTIGDVLVPFGCGELEVDSVVREVRYRLRVAHLVVFATVAVCGMAAILLSVRFPSRIIMISFLLVAWMWVVGGGILLGVPRFNAFLHRSISSAPKTPASAPETD
ncbi:MAG: hypothetical protein ACYTAS_20085 [Planctomycetota bacterium]|jgi:hypothetical protein